MRLELSNNLRLSLSLAIAITHHPLAPSVGHVLVSLLGIWGAQEKVLEISLVSAVSLHSFG